MSETAYCTSCGAELPAGVTMGGPCRSCGATPTPAPTLVGHQDPVETLAEQIRRQLWRHYFSSSPNSRTAAA